MLRRHASRAGLDAKFTIIDREDAISIVRRGIKELKLDKRTLPSPSEIVTLISAAVNKERLLRDLVRGQAPDYVAYADQIVRLCDFYTEFKEARNCLDYDDLLMGLIDLLIAHPGVRAGLQEKYRWILVDEAQDLNGLQVKAVELLAGESNRVFQVGDDAQAIYTWRGARPDNLQTFVDSYPDVRVVTLEDNHRSCQPILDLANHVLRQMPRAFRKTLRATRAGGCTVLATPVIR